MTRARVLGAAAICAAVALAFVAGRRSVRPVTAERVAPDGTMRLPNGVAVLTGTPIFGPTAFSGNTLLTADQLSKAVAFRPGQEFDQKLVDESVARITDMYARAGRPRAGCAANWVMLNQSPPRRDYTFAIAEGPAAR